MSDKLGKEKHKERHEMLHRYLDELVGDFTTHTSNLLSETTIITLMTWAHEQTKEPAEVM